MFKNREGIPTEECTQPGVCVCLEHPRIQGGIKMDKRKGSRSWGRRGVLSQARFCDSCAENRFPPEFRKGSIECIPHSLLWQSQGNAPLPCSVCTHPPTTKSHTSPGLQSQNTNTGPRPAEGHPRSHQGPTLGSWGSYLFSPGPL